MIKSPIMHGNLGTSFSYLTLVTVEISSLPSDQQGRLRSTVYIGNCYSVRYGGFSALVVSTVLASSYSVPRSTASADSGIVAPVSLCSGTVEDPNPSH